MDKNVRQTIRTFILDNYMHGASPSDLDDAASFIESGIIDSTGVMELILFIENELGVKVEDTEILPENLDSVERVCRYLESKRSGQRESSSRVAL
jgi:acyl carrier protein